MQPKLNGTALAQVNTLKTVYQFILFHGQVSHNQTFTSKRLSFYIPHSNLFKFPYKTHIT